MVFLGGYSVVFWVGAIEKIRFLIYLNTVGLALVGTSGFYTALLLAFARYVFD